MSELQEANEMASEIFSDLEIQKREISKPAILGAPYNFENVGDPNDGLNSEPTKTGLFGYFRSQNEPDPVEQVAAFVLTFQRELETLQDNLVKMFKQIGHGDEWNRITK